MVTASSCRGREQLGRERLTAQGQLSQLLVAHTGVSRHVLVVPDGARRSERVGDAEHHDLPDRRGQLTGGS